MNLYIYKNNKENKTNARTLRKTQTDAESLLWFSLRGRKIAGFKFRRQFSIGTYIVDFYCPEKKLVIELDGGQHNNSSARRYDQERTNFLNKLDIRVLRYWDNDVFMNLDGILDEIFRTLMSTRKTSP